MKTASNLRPASSPVALAGSLSDQQHLSDLIGVVYDAAIDPSLWENAIQRATYFVCRRLPRRQPASLWI